MPSQGGMGVSTHEELRQGCHFKGKATPQLLHCDSNRSVTFYQHNEQLS